jgi:hypothetical protein
MKKNKILYTIPIALLALTACGVPTEQKPRIESRASVALRLQAKMATFR